MVLSYLNIVSVIILFQLTLLVFFLVSSKKGKKISNRLLALFFTLLIINLGDGLLAFYGFYSKYPQYAHLEDGFVFLLGPVIYFYTRTMIYHDFRLRGSHLVHIIPFIVLTLAYQIFYHLQSEVYQKKIQDAIVNQTLPFFFYISAALIYIHVSIYMIFALLELREYRRRIKETFSSIDKINMDWLSFMLWSIVFILIFSFVYTFLPIVGLRDYFNLVFGVAFFLIFVFINGVVWKGLQQPEIFAGIENIPSGSEKKYQATLSAQEKKTISSAVDNILKADKLYLNADLNLDSLAGAVGYPPKKVSQIINECFGQNFFDYINSYRIAEAQKILKESNDPKLTVLEVMYASGFNSKSSFNTIFKQKTGLTPSAFRRSLSNQDSV